MDMNVEEKEKEHCALQFLFLKEDNELKLDTKRSHNSIYT
jgi:hypothetical protein